ncbi:MAG: helix-turn-helix domain-containing protein [Bacteroidales bacterium]|nr:helix-turn-helix domain-containing protein [Bacteroidales bacterium]
MRKTRRCAFCGKEFVVNSGMQKYCSEECAERAKSARRKRQQDFLHAVEPALELQNQEYLTFAKAAVLMGCSRQYIYKLVAQGMLPASRISSRMSFVRKADIERMLSANPYHRVLPTARPKKSKVPSPKTSASSLPSHSKVCNSKEEILDYLSGEEVMERYKVKKSWLYASAKRNQVPICRIAGQNYYSRRHLDEIFGLSVDVDSIEEWLTTHEAMELYSLSAGSLHSYAHRHHIPTKREYGQTYYSKEHLDALRRTDLVADDRYYTTEQVAEKYGMTKSNVCHIVKVQHITKVKVGVKNLLPKIEVDKVMADRLAQYGSYRIQQ